MVSKLLQEENIAKGGIPLSLEEFDIAKQPGKVIQHIGVFGTIDDVPDNESEDFVRLLVRDVYHSA